jgi:transcriptional regulator EpsA
MFESRDHSRKHAHSMHSQNIEGSQQGSLEGRRAEALVRMVEAGIDVHRRHQFFVWARSSLNQLIPHQILVCGSYQRAQANLTFEAVYGVPLSPYVLELLTDSASPLVHSVVNEWLHQRGRSLRLPLHDLDISPADRDRLSEVCLGSALVQGVTRPQRPTEIESLFMLWSGGDSDDAQCRRHLDIVLPCLHATYRRVLETERRLAPHRAPPGSGPIGAEFDMPMSARERQILQEVQQGRSTQDIGERLDISPYTVKNHVHNILRKLGATTRAQAVSKAMSLGLLEPAASSLSASPDALSSRARPYPPAPATPALCPAGPAAARHPLRSRGAAAPRSPARCLPPPPSVRRAPALLPGRPPSGSQ